MRKSEQPKFKISARNLGPILSLEGDLGCSPRNLIFDRNGAAKSSLCRAFQLIDQCRQNQDIPIAVKNLISREPLGGNIDFTISRGASDITKFVLQKRDENPTLCVSDTIFHVFSEKFVNEEVKEIKYKITENETEEKIILIGKQNIKMDEIKQKMQEINQKIENKKGGIGIFNMEKLNREIRSCEDEIKKIGSEAHFIYARDLVADTFCDLLEYFFGTKYAFNKEKFLIIRKDSAPKIGPAEKTIIAFCYFVACIHRKITSHNEYGSFFWVFDDPVSSLSYKYIYDISHALDTLQISKRGRVKIDVPMRGSMQTNSVDVDDDYIFRPNLLILTKNVYFYNILTCSKIIKHDSCFLLFSSDSEHEPGSSKYELRLLEKR